MNNLANMLWIEWRKALRSKMPLWTALGSMMIPLGIAFLIFVSKNPQISQKLGVMSAKADLVAYAAADWSTYLELFGQFMAAGGFILFILIVSWTFGREFTDGTLKDLLAVPVPRASILLAKFIVVAAWSAALALVIFMAGLLMGFVLQLPGGSLNVIVQGADQVVVTALLTIPLVLPFALFASLGRGYLLPIGVAVVTLMVTNLIIIVGWGQYFPWAIAGLYTVDKGALTPISYWIILVTSLAGMFATYVWWKYADQNR